MNRTIFLQATAGEIAHSVTAREYNRLLQLPRDRELKGDLRDRAEEARSWYEKNGNPFIAAHKVELQEIRSDSVLLPHGMELRSVVLARRLSSGEAHALMILAASAGAEVANEVAKRWAEEKPDEAFFLDRFAVAVTERLIFWSSATLCHASERDQETLLPHLSPGCGNWDLEDQHKLMAMLADGNTTLGPIELLPSAALHPQHSILAAMGITRRKFANAPELLCRSCDLDPCAFRRAPHGEESLRPLEIQ